MTSPSASGGAAETLDEILHRLLPLLLAAALSAKSLVGRWRLLHSRLLLLHASLSSAASSLSSTPNPLFLSLLPSLLSTLRSLLPLSSRCLDPSLPSGKLHLQSDLDSLSSSLSLHLHDLHLLLSSDLLSHSPLPSNSLILPFPSSNSSSADLSLFLRDLFARLQIGSLDLKLKALDSLLQLLNSNPSKYSNVIAQECDLSSLIRLLDSSNHSMVRDQAAAAVSILAVESDVSRKAIFEEGALGPLLRLLESGSACVKERAAAAVEAITADTANAWAVSAYAGIGILIDACRSGVGGSPAVNALAAGSLKNISAVEDFRSAMAEEGAAPVLIELLSSGTISAQKNAAVCLASLASDSEDTRVSIVNGGGLQRLLQLIREAPDPETLDYSLKAIRAVSASPSAAKYLSSSLLFFNQLSDLIKRGNPAVQQTAAALIADLSPGEEIKKSIGGCMAALVKMMESPKPAAAQEAAARALVALLAVRSNRRELARDEKSVTRLVQMMEPAREEVCKKFPVSVVAALAAGGGGGCRKRLAEAGACGSLQRLVEADVAGAKKALQRIAGGRIKNLFSIGWRE